MCAATTPSCLRRLLPAIAVGAAVAISGCSDQAAATASSRTAPSASPGVVDPTAGEQVTTGPVAGTATPAATGADAGLPALSARPVKGVTTTDATESVGATFAPVTRSAGTVVTRTELSAVRADGRDIGGLAVYTVPAGSAASQTFRDQFVAQLLAPLSKDGRRERVRIGNTPVALVRSDTPAAGWFDGDRVVVLSQRRPTPAVQDVVAALIGRLPAAKA